MPERGAAPALSVVALVPDCFETVERSIRALAAQSIAGSIELVVVTPDTSLTLPEEVVGAFHTTRIVGAPAWHSTSEARATGIRQASAPVVAMVEDHCFPTPGWAEALVAAHREPWSGVGPVILNANPATLVSWANLVIEYGPWMPPLPRGACSHIPGHNSSYKRDVLLTYGDRLGGMMEAESIMQWDLARQGHRFAIEPAARSCHQNFSRFDASIALRFHVGRLFAANRAREWGPVRRAAFAAGSVLLPFLRTWRSAGHARRLRDSRPRRGLTALIFVLLSIDALGEMTGYALGGGSSMLRLTDLEFHRERFVSPLDHQRSSA